MQLWLELVRRDIMTEEMTGWGNGLGACLGKGASVHNQLTTRTNITDLFHSTSFGMPQQGNKLYIVN